MESFSLIIYSSTLENEHTLFVVMCRCGAKWLTGCFFVCVFVLLRRCALAHGCPHCRYVNVRYVPSSCVAWKLSGFADYRKKKSELPVLFKERKPLIIMLQKLLLKASMYLKKQNDANFSLPASVLCTTMFLWQPFHFMEALIMERKPSFFYEKFSSWLSTQDNDLFDDGAFWASSSSVSNYNHCYTTKFSLSPEYFWVCCNISVHYFECMSIWLPSV